jgi:hypothetical protein
MREDLHDFLLEEDKTFEELLREFDEDALWEKYMEDHLKEEEECRRRANLRRQKKRKMK